MKAPNKIFLHWTEDGAEISFGSKRKRRILYEANNKLQDNEHIIFTRKNVKNKETPTICELHQSAGIPIYKPKDTLRPAGVKDTFSFCDPENTFTSKNGKKVCGHVYGSECENKGCCKLCLERCNSRCHHSRIAGEQ